MSALTEFKDGKRRLWVLLVGPQSESDRPRNFLMRKYNDDTLAILAWLTQEAASDWFKAARKLPIAEPVSVSYAELQDFVRDMRELRPQFPRKIEIQIVENQT